jgi:hypothetical protein
MKSIEITFDEIGKPTIEAKGFNGVGCKAATQSLEVLLAGAPASDSDRKPKPEMFNSSAAKQTQTGR